MVDVLEVWLTAGTSVFPQVSGGHLFCLPAHADDGLGSVCGWFCEEAGARERAEAARGKVFFYLKNDQTRHLISAANTNFFAYQDAL